MATTTLHLAIDARRAKTGATQFKAASKEVQVSANKAAAAARTLRGSLAQLAGGFTAVLAARSAIGVIATFEEQLVTLSQVARATESQLAALEGTARKLGATTRFSATEAAEGLTFLARAGFGVQDAIDALPATLDLAQVGMIELGQAADFASNIVSQFGLHASDTTRVVDALVITANRSNTSVLQMAEAMKFTGTIAGSLGLSVEEVAAAIGVLGDVGKQGSLAGTGLRGIMAQLKKPTDEAEAALRALGLTMEDVDPQKNGFIGAFENLAAAGLDATNAFSIFNVRTADAALAIANATKKANRLVSEMADFTGEARQSARALDSTLIGSFKGLTSALSELALQAGDGGLLSTLREAIQTTTQFVQVLGGDPDALREAGEGMKDLAKAVGGLADAASLFIGLRLGASLVRMVASAAQGTGLLVRLAAVMVKPWSLVGLGIAAAAVAMRDFNAEVRDLLSQTSKLFFEGIDSKVNALMRIQREARRAFEVGDLADQRAAQEKQIQGLKGLSLLLREQVDAIKDLGEPAARLDLETIRKALGVKDLDQFRESVGVLPRTQTKELDVPRSQTLDQMIRGEVLEPIRIAVERVTPREFAIELFEAKIKQLESGLGELKNSTSSTATGIKGAAAAIADGTIKINQAFEEFAQNLIFNSRIAGRSSGVQEREIALREGAAAKGAPLTQQERADIIRQVNNAQINQMVGNVGAGIGDAIGNGATSAVLASINEKGNALREAFNNILRQMANDVISTLLQPFRQALSDFARDALVSALGRGAAGAAGAAAAGAGASGGFAGIPTQSTTIDIGGLPAGGGGGGTGGGIASSFASDTSATSIAALGTAASTTTPFVTGFGTAATGATPFITGLGTSATTATPFVAGLGTAATTAAPFLSGLLTPAAFAAGAMEVAGNAAIEFAVKMKIAQAIGGPGGGIAAAKGAVFTPSGITAFATGGTFTNSVVSRPTPFAFQGGLGVMGEAGDEAIVPLKRGPGGRLGIEAFGSQRRSGAATFNDNRRTQITFNIATDDADSFRRSRRQIINDLQASMRDRTRR